jgi:hypothetical protein
MVVNYFFTLAEFEFSTDADHGGILPKRLREYDYHADH